MAKHNNTFNQYLSQYHSAKIPIYDTDNNMMHTLFFGGMSQYKLDADGNLIQDDNVPFVKTISKVSRFRDGSMIESSLDIEMPTLLGSGAEFIPINKNSNYLSDEIVDIKWVSLSEIHENLKDYSKQVGIIAEHLLLNTSF